MWVRVLGLLEHLRGKEFFKRVGDACGGFMMVDIEVEERRHLKWVRSLVKSSGKRCLTVHLWWEVLPWLLILVSKRSTKSLKVRINREGSSRAARRVEEKEGRHVVDCRVSKDNRVTGQGGYA